MSVLSSRTRSLWLAAAAVTVIHTPSTAQNARPLPEVVVNPEAVRRTPARPAAQRAAPRNRNISTVAAPTASPATGPVVPGSLTTATAAQAYRDITQTPGAVAVVRGADYQNSTPASTIKDILDYVPGVIAQPKWGDDSRLSIRGSGLSRNFHLRGVQLYLDGIPINTADGYGDFQEIDPSAYRFVEVYKGANALRFGANALGGAINFVTPSGRDAPITHFGVDLGSFGFGRLQASTAGANGAWDGFVTAAGQRAEGFRDHSDGQSLRGSANIGYRISDNLETRFYFNANTVRQRIPGAVTKTAALTTPELAAAGNLTNDQQRNIDTVRVANKTTLRLDNTTIEAGIFAVNRHLMHPIFQWLDYQYDDYGLFGRITDDRQIAGHRNRFIAGVNVHNGTLDNRQFANIGGNKGALLSSSLDKSNNTSVYVENSFYLVPQLAIVAGTQFLHATRVRRDRFLTNGDQSGASEYNLFSPKGGLLWQLDPTWQVFANISRSAEVPSFGENTFATAFLSNLRPQRATTYEIGTRGRRPNVTWDVAFYRANIDNEFLCLTNPGTPGACNVVNADRSFHQGVEAAFGVAVLDQLFVRGEKADKVWINLAYTWSDFHFRNDPLYGNNFIPGAPPHYLRAEVLYRHPTGFYAGPNVEWVPTAYFVDSANTVRTEPYALLGFKTGFDNGGPWSGYIEARNLTNRKYIASVSIAERANAASALFEPGTGLAVYGGMKFKFN